MMFLIKKKYSKPNDPPIDFSKLIGKLNQKCQDSASYLRKNIRKIQGTLNVYCIVLANTHFQTHLNTTMKVKIKVKVIKGMEMKLIHLVVILNFWPVTTNHMLSYVLIRSVAICQHFIYIM